MKETQHSISRWAEETFGTVGSNARVAARANEEMAELLRGVTSGAPDEDLLKEAADVKIILYRLATRMNFDLNEQAALVGVYEDEPSETHSVKANLEMAALVGHLIFGWAGTKGRGHAGCVVARLEQFAVALGFDLDAEIDRKMAVNRQRVWKKDGTGHGYHVREKAEAAR